MALIRCDVNQVQLAASFPCQVVDFPIKYMGLPLLVTKLPRTALQPLADEVADQLPTWKGKLMHRSGRLVLIKTTLSSMSVYTSISIELPLWLLKALTKIMKAFLWSETDQVQGGKCLVVWCSVQRLIQLRGLGITDLKLLGIALHLRWLWLHCTDGSRSWSAMPIQVDKTSQALFKAHVKYILGHGKAILFWSDTWLDGDSILDMMSELGAMVPLRRHHTRTVASALHLHGWIRDILGLLMVLVLMQYLSLRERL
jgi:hypothetical protein